MTTDLKRSGPILQRPRIAVLAVAALTLGLAACNEGGGADDAAAPPADPGATESPTTETPAQ